MRIPLYQIDAFARGPFTGNPAAVCPLETWLPDGTMQNIAMENNLSETAFFVKQPGGFQIRWFTPTVEVDLCGHATLASAFVLFNILGYSNPLISFNSRSGILSVRKSDTALIMDFPSDQAIEIDHELDFKECLGVSPIRILKGKDDYLCVFDNPSDVENVDPAFAKLKLLESRGVIVTAPGFGEFDFVSRGFFPQSGIDEDPATGSAHTLLTPFWSKTLGKKYLKAKQISKRGGYFECEDKEERTLISGRGHHYLTGEIIV